MPDIELKILKVDQIIPNPFQPRESFPKEDIQQLADSLKATGLLQPIAVRKKGETFQIISGERRWRAAQFAGLKEIPSIIKDVSDAELMMQSLVENVQRKDLEPMEKARGLAEVYRLVGFEPTKAATILNTKLHWIPKRWRLSDLSQEEKRIKETADTVGLSYDYQYRLLSLLKFTPDEQRRVSELRLGYEEASSIATIERPDTRQRLIELAPDLKRQEVKTISKLVKKADEPVVEALLEKKISPDVAEVIAEIEKPEIREEVLRRAEKGVYTTEGIKTIIGRLEHPPVELPEESVEIQLHNKTLWNLRRVADYDFYTIGFAKRTIEQFLELLKAKKIKTLVDVRKNPKSMYKVEFNRENLAAVLKKEGIGYIHYPDLGVPEETRRKLGETGDYEWFFKSYDDNILPNLKNLDLKALASPVAMMCVEFDPTKCHRHRIALALEKQGLRGYDL